MQYNLLPYKHEQTGVLYSRLLIEPVMIPESETATGLKIPATELLNSQIGVVFATCAGSSFKQGDEVQYRKGDRARNEKMETAVIDGKNYDVIYEHKIWAHNNKPYNQLFVRQITETQVSEGGILIPAEVESITRKGIVYDAPDYFRMKKGDVIEYQNQIGGYYPTATIDGVVYDVIFEADVFTVNGECAPYRIIVKIDMVMQQRKRTTTQSGLKLSPLFIAMLRNLQYGEVAGIGEEAKKLFPELKVGDTVITEHAVESQDYRLLKYDFGKVNPQSPIYEYRIINCYDFSDREIFGKLHFHKNSNKIISITPLNGCKFFKWEFDLFDGGENNKSSSLLEVEGDLSLYHNIDDLRNVVIHKKKEAAEKAKQKTSGLKQILIPMDRERHKDQWDVLTTELGSIEREEKRFARHIDHNHLVVLKQLYPKEIPPYVITQYQQLYPINLMGQKFLIGYDDFLLFKTHSNMNITGENLTALNDVVLVLPFAEESKSELIIPDSARQIPQYGTIIKIGENEAGVKPGDFVLFRQYAGLQQQIDGAPHLIMKQNDLLMINPDNPLNKK